MTRISVEERFWAKVEKTDGCWNWTAKRYITGYGSFTTTSNYKTKTFLAHRFVFRVLGVNIPDGKLVDHICHNRACVRPDHLRFVTNKENHEHLAGPYASSSSGVRGVSWNAERQKWRAQVYHNGKCHFLGLFDSVAAAGEAALNKRLELFTHNDLDRAA